MDDKALVDSFFSAWAEVNAEARAGILAKCLGADCVYADPNCPGPLIGPEAIGQMLGSFTAKMPGGSAWVVGEPSAHNGFSRVTVAFGKDGVEMMRGQYFARRNGEHLTMIVGFTGTGG